MKLVKSLIASALLLGTMAANATVLTISQTGSKALTVTNWVDTASVDKFDGTLGALQRVVLEIDGQAFGDAGYENKSDNLNTITLTFGANTSGSIGGLILPFSAIANATSVNVFNSVPPFDGLIDFTGTSGDTLVGLNPTASASADSDSVNALIRALFLTGFVDADGDTGSGLDTLTLDLAGAGASQATDTQGNVASSFTTNAGLDWTLTYFYEDGEVPAPTPLALIALGALGLAGARRAAK